MGVIVWIIVGIVGALIANRMPDVTETKDKVLNFVLSIIGAVVAGFAANLVMFMPVFGITWASFAVSILGSLVFLSVLALVRR